MNANEGPRLRIATSMRLLGLCVVLFPSLVASAAPETPARGRDLAFDRNKGNCLSCHMIEGGELPGNSGPPLLAMQLRFPERAALRAQIADAGVRNPDTVMPPYGRNRILTEEELDLVTDFIHSL